MHSFDKKLTKQGINQVNVGVDRSSRVALRDAVDKLKHLSSAERAKLIQIMTVYYDLFRYDHSGMLHCTNNCLHEIKIGDAVPIKKAHMKCRMR